MHDAIRKIALGLVLAAAATVGRAEALAQLDLVGAYRMAQARDPLYESARYAFEAVQERVPQARAALLPSLSLAGNAGRQQGESAFGDTGFVDRNVRNWAWSLQLAQPLLRVGAWASLDAARAQERQAAARFALAETELVLRVAQAYFDILVAQDAIVVTDAQLKAVREQLDLARHNYRVGSATVTDVHEAKSRFDLARAQRVAALSERESKLAELERIIGAQPMSMMALGPGQVLPAPQPQQALPWMDQARTSNPEVLAQQAAREAAQQELKRSRAEHLPTLDATASYGSNYSSGTMSSPADIATRTRAGQVGLQLNIPLFSGGLTTSRASEAAALLSKAGSDVEASRRLAASQARQAYEGVSSALARCEALMSAVDASRSSVEANRVGYRTGTRINIDVLNAEQQLYATEHELERSRYEALLQGLRLKAAAGALQASEVDSVNALLGAAVTIAAPIIPGSEVKP